ncbi:MAG: hypothetical protein WKF37_17605 [Bryobacteraceae bacterium]
MTQGKTLLPQMYGDPRGYKHDGKPEWYHYTGNLFQDKLAEIYFWSMDRKDLERVPKTGWIAFLEGESSAYPVEALQAGLDHVRRNMREIEADPTTADTRLADYLLELNPASTDALANLTMGAYFSNNRIWTLHSRFRYFDPVQRRAGLPADVGALVEKLEANAATLVLVNVIQCKLAMIVQAGGYGEHRFESIEVDGRTQMLPGPAERSAPARMRARIDFEWRDT